jgi:hypothetical protein
MSENVQVEGSGAWAAAKIAQGHAVRSRAWFAGSVHPHHDDRTRVFFRSGRSNEVQGNEDRDLGSAAEFFAARPDDVWELADKPRRATAGASTVLDLYLFPDALPVVTVRALLTKLEEAGDDLGDLIALVWQSAGQTLIGQALRALLQHEGIPVQLQLARNGDPRARAALIESIVTLRDGR